MYTLLNDCRLTDIISISLWLHRAQVLKWILKSTEDFFRSTHFRNLRRIFLWETWILVWGCTTNVTRNERWITNLQASYLSRDLSNWNWHVFNFIDLLLIKLSSVEILLPSRDSVVQSLWASKSAPQCRLLSAWRCIILLSGFIHSLRQGTECSTEEPRADQWVTV